MARTGIHIDISEVINHNRYMHELNPKRIPRAIRGTLNKLAFDLKGNTLPESAMRFEHRTKNFYKANTRVEKVASNNVREMHSAAGFQARSGTVEQAVEDQQMQEQGGIVHGRAFIPLNEARVGRSYGRMVRRENRISAIKDLITDAEGTEAGGFIKKKNVITRNGNHGVSKKQQFVRAAVYAAGKGGLIIGTFQKSKNVRFLMRIKGFSRDANNNLKVKTQALYSVKKGRNVRETATHFVKKAADMTHKKVRAFWEEEAVRILSYS